MNWHTETRILAEMVAAGNTETKYLELLAAQVIALAKGEGR